MSKWDADKIVTVFSWQLVDDIVLASNVTKQATKPTVGLLKKKTFTRNVSIGPQYSGSWSYFSGIAITCTWNVLSQKSTVLLMQQETLSVYKLMMFLMILDTIMSKFLFWQFLSSIRTKWRKTIPLLCVNKKHVLWLWTKPC